MTAYQRAQWPDDFDARVIEARAEGRTWHELDIEFGVGLGTVRARALGRCLFEPKPSRRFTAEDDRVIRSGYTGQRNLKELAVEIGCSYGVLRQRIFHHHKDLVRTVRTSAGTKALKRYGADLMRHGATPDDASKAIRGKIIAAKAAARVAAISAKQRHSAQLLEAMLSDIAAGKPRNRAIFESRMLGLSLDSIGRSFGLTRERIRQICDAEAFEATLNADSEIPPRRDFLLVGSPA